jgi:hypothetical protein
MEPSEIRDASVIGTAPNCAEFIIGRAFARPVGSIRVTKLTYEKNRALDSRDLLKLVNLICPTGKSATAGTFALSSPDRKNISVFPKSNPLYIPRRLVPNEGRIAIVTDVGNGMWWTRQCQVRNRGRRAGFGS